MSNPRSNLYLWLLAGVLALIVYGSLYPFDFERVDGGLWAALRELSWQRAGRNDRIVNVLLYLPLGFCLFLGLATRFRRRAAGIVAVVAGATLSLALEVAQAYTPVRVPSLTDITLNVLGAALGVAGGAGWRALGALMHLPSHDDAPLTRDPGAGLVLALWFGWRFAPFVPHLDLAKLKSALRPLFSPTFDATHVFMYLTCWLVVNQAISARVARPRRYEALLLVIAIVLVGRLLVAEQVFVPSELVALLLLLPLAVVMQRLSSLGQRSVLIVALAVLVLLEWLAPFDFVATPSAIDPWPFRPWFQQDLLATLRSLDWVGLLGKAFLLGALLWLLNDACRSINTAIALVTGAVVVLEVLQLWLPGRSGSILGPLLALSTGLVFRYLYQRTRPHRYARILS